MIKPVSRLSPAYVFPEFENPFDGYVHAIGSINTAWNHLELMLNTMISFSSLSREEIQLLIAKFNNHMKFLFIKATFTKDMRSCPSQSNNLDEFLKLCQICSQNRNFYIHAEFSIDARGPKFTKRKEGKMGMTNTIRPILSEVQNVSNEIYAVANFGSKVLMRLRLTDDSGLAIDETTGGIIRIEQPQFPILLKTWDTHPTFEENG